MTNASGTQRHVLDASALLAFAQGEPGGNTVRPLLPMSFVSALNWSEVYQKGVRYGLPIEGLGSDLAAAGLVIVPFGAEDAEAAARLWPQTRSLGLSLGDRACLALALTLGAPVWTADRAWQELMISDLTVRLVR